jgi:MFS family permease
MGPGSAPLSDHPKTVNLCEEPVVAVLNGWIGQLFDWRNIDVTVAAPVDSQSGQRDSGGRKRQAGDVGRRGPNHAARPSPPMRLAASTVGLALAAAEPAAWTLLVGSAVLAVGVAFLTPAVFAAIFTLVPASDRGSAAGPPVSSSTLASTVAPYCSDSSQRGAGFPRRSLPQP